MNNGVVNQPPPAPHAGELPLKTWVVVPRNGRTTTQQTEYRRLTSLHPPQVRSLATDRTITPSGQAKDRVHQRNHANQRQIP